MSLPPVPNAPPAPADAMMSADAGLPPQVGPQAPGEGGGGAEARGTSPSAWSTCSGALRAAMPPSAGSPEGPGPSRSGPYGSGGSDRPGRSEGASVLQGDRSPGSGQPRSASRRRTASALDEDRDNGESLPEFNLGITDHHFASATTTQAESVSFASMLQASLPAASARWKCAWPR